VSIAKNNMKNKTFLFLAIGILSIGVLSYFLKVGIFKQSQQNSNETSDTKKLQIVTSFYPLYYFVTQIAGDKANVKNITPSGAEPHDYDPSTQDVANIEKSNMLVLNGGVEAWGAKIRDNLKGTNVTIITAGEGLLTQKIEEEGQNQIDPHVWLDPINAKKEAHAITLGLEKIDPSNSLYYQQKENILNVKLDHLDSEFKTGLASCKQKDIITSHAAFGYLATRYNLRQVSIAGLSPDAEPSAQQLADVAKFAKANAVKYIFFESLVSPKLSQTVATEIGAETLVLDPIEGVSEDDMKAGKDYYSIMQDNLKNLQIALECNK
jgi:zinc transport system substrate-binding protein